MTQRKAPLILLADDDAAVRTMVREALTKRGYAIIEASDGAEALEQLARQRPVAVVLDVMMPGKNGWEVTRDLRRDPQLKDTKVIMLTGIGERLNELTSPLYGADAYLDKPFKLEELERVLIELLGSAAAEAR